MTETTPNPSEVTRFDEQAFTELVAATQGLLATEQPENWPFLFGIDYAFDAITTDESAKIWTNSLATEHVDTTLDLFEQLAVFSNKGKQHRFGPEPARKIASSAQFFISFTWGSELVNAANARAGTARGDRINGLLYSHFSASRLVSYKVAAHMTSLLPERLEPIIQNQDETAGKAWAEKARTTLHGLGDETLLLFGTYLTNLVKDPATVAFTQKILDEVLYDFQAVRAVLPLYGLSGIKMNNAWDEGYGQAQLENGELYGITPQEFRVRCMRNIIELENKHEGAARWLYAKRGWRSNFGRFSVQTAESQYLDGIEVAKKTYRPKKRTVIPMPIGDHNGAHMQSAKKIEALLAKHKLQAVILEIGRNREALARISQGTREGWLPAEITIFTAHGTPISFLWSGQRLNGNDRFEQVLAKNLETIPQHIGAMLCIPDAYNIFLGCQSALAEGGLVSTFAKISRSRACGTIGKTGLYSLELNLDAEPLSANAHFVYPNSNVIQPARITTQMGQSTPLSRDSILEQ